VTLTTGQWHAVTSSRFLERWRGWASRIAHAYHHPEATATSRGSIQLEGREVWTAEYRAWRSATSIARWIENTITTGLIAEWKSYTA